MHVGGRLDISVANKSTTAFDDIVLRVFLACEVPRVVCAWRVPRVVRGVERPLKRHSKSKQFLFGTSAARRHAYATDKPQFVNRDTAAASCVLWTIAQLPQRYSWRRQRQKDRCLRHPPVETPPRSSSGFIHSLYVFGIPRSVATWRQASILTQRATAAACGRVTQVVK